MKNFLFLNIIVVLFLVIGAINVQCVPLAINRIEGQVTDKNGVPVAEAFVELSNWVGNLLGRTRTSTSGRFSFVGVSSGRFIIKVLPLGKKLLVQEQDVEVTNQNARSDIVFVEFVLQPDKRGEEVAQAAPGTIFVQDVPVEAKNLCESGVRKLAQDPARGLSDLERAVKIFPNYFDALYYLGSGYSNQKEFEKAYIHLLKAVDVNARSSAAYYMLGYAFYQLKEIPAALLAAKSVVMLSPNSIEGHLLYGTLLRLNNNLREAEAVLVKAKSLDKRRTAEIHWQLALVFNKQERNQEAADELKTYLEIAPDSPEKQKVKELIIKLKASKKK